jgi:hypothetical protein
MIDSKANDPLDSLRHRYPWISDGMTGVGATGKASSGAECPVSEGLVPGQPSSERVPLHFMGGDPPRVWSAGRGWGTPRGNDHRSVDDLAGRVKCGEPYGRRIEGLDPTDDVSRSTARQPVPHRPSFVQ